MWWTQNYAWLGGSIESLDSFGGGALNYWKLLEEHWELIVECSTWNPFLVDMHTLELEMCHLELECFTCDPINCLVSLLVMDMLHFIMRT